MAAAALPALARLANGAVSKGTDLFVKRTSTPAKVSKAGNVVKPAVEREWHLDPKGVAYIGVAAIAGVVALAAGSLWWSGAHIKTPIGDLGWNGVRDSWRKEFYRRRDEWRRNHPKPIKHGGP